VKAKIAEKKEVAEGTLNVKFDLLGEKVSFKPGQHLDVTLINPPYTDAEGDQRTFSINNPPSESSYLSITTRIRDSAFKRSLRDLPIGTEVEIDSIRGVFVLPEKEKRPLVFIAGGIGITPFLSMLRHLAKTGFKQKVTFLYSNHDVKSTPYLDELEKIEEENSNFKLILTMTRDQNWKGESRHIDSSFIKEYFPKGNDNFYLVAGPPEMVEAVFNSLLEAGVESKNIRTENFSGY